MTHFFALGDSSIAAKGFLENRSDSFGTKARLQIKLLYACSSFCCRPWGRGAEGFGETFPAGTPSIAAGSVLPGLRMMYGAGVCNLGFAAVPGEMCGKKKKEGGLGTE